MTQDEIIEMATQVSERNYGRIIFFEFEVEELEAFAKLVVAKATAKEREACAKVAEQVGEHKNQHGISAAIRARGEQT